MDKYQELREAVTTNKWSLSLSVYRKATGALLAERDAAIGLLGIAVCPDKQCDNKGVTVEPVQVCCGRGDESGCCGEPDIDFDAAPCQWCHERDALLEAAKRQEGVGNE